jgi:hypothetical protein
MPSEVVLHTITNVYGQNAVNIFRLKEASNDISVPIAGSRIQKISH